MKFLSNFDTELESRIVEQYNKQYGQWNLLVIHRAKIFWVFNCLMPTIGLFVVAVILALLMGMDTGEPTLNGVKSVIGALMMAWVVMGWGRKVLKRYFDYKMDFCVVTPQEIVAYNQTGFLWRTSRTIDADKIKTVSANPNGFIRAIFNYGDLTFLSEWDQSGGWDIGLSFVHNVNYTKNKVRDLIEPHLQKHMKEHAARHAKHE
jgi:hypothetical protein